MKSFLRNVIGFVLYILSDEFETDGKL